jgi:hypothetical protein
LKLYPKNMACKGFVLNQSFFTKENKNKYLTIIIIIIIIIIIQWLGKKEG